jgi:transcriptional regulator with XRE-family HTH domain
VAHIGNLDGASLPEMPRQRPKFHPELGVFFQQLREERGWGQRQAAAFAEKKNLPRLSRQVLIRLERGQIKNPEPETLRSLSVLYGTAYEDLLRRYVLARYGTDLGRDLIRHAEAEPSTPLTNTSGGGADVPAEARVLTDTERRVLQDVITAATEIVERGEEILDRAGQVLGGQTTSARARASARAAHPRRRR